MRGCVGERVARGRRECLAGAGPVASLGAMDENSPETAVQRRIPQPDDFPIAGPNSLAGLGQRAVGWFIDGMITFVPVFLIGLVVLAQVDPDYQPDPDSGIWDPWLPPLMSLSLAAVWVIYQVLCVHLAGTTLGGLAIGLRVARYTDGGKPDWSQATLRALVPGVFFALPMMIVSSMWLVVYAFALYNPLRRGLQDQAGGTIVVRTR